MDRFHEKNALSTGGNNAIISQCNNYMKPGKKTKEKLEKGKFFHLLIISFSTLETFKSRRKLPN